MSNPIKMLKLEEDPCFGRDHEGIDQCEQCWLKKSCFASFRNRKD
ncbi:MAG: hypothetical protein QGH82_01615 [Candidatus Woesearchaeota archaeon]|nr:hypothetical protein [Candidatus Woesearchaeota archaeon]